MFSLLIRERRMIRKLLLFLCFGFLSLVSAQDDSESGGKFSGLVFGDYYYAVNNHDMSIKDQHGFWIRRIYFTYDYTIDKSWSTRLRFEMSNDGDFESSNTMVPVVKDAWLRYKFAGQSVYLGISPTPTYSLIEDVWGYRSVEKCPADLYKIRSSRDFGIAGKGKFDKDGIFNYHLMYGNGNSNKQEIDKGKLGMLSLSAKLKNGLVIEGYGDYADQKGHTDTYMLQGFIGYQSEKLNAGIQYSSQWIQEVNSENNELRILSGFVTGNVSECFSLLIRGDRVFDPVPKADGIDFLPLDPNSKFTLIIFGVDFHPVKNVKIIPNIEFVKYDENSNGVTPDNDLFARLTYFWSFN